MIPIKSGSQLINLLFSCDTLPAASMAGMTCPHPPCREWQASLGLASKWHHLLDHVMATPEELSGPCSEQKAVVGGLQRKPRHDGSLPYWEYFFLEFWQLLLGCRISETHLPFLVMNTCSVESEVLIALFS